jgi:hypothetical protein
MKADFEDAAAGSAVPHVSSRNTSCRPLRATGGKGARRFGARERMRDKPLPTVGRQWHIALFVQWPLSSSPWAAAQL